LLSRSISDQINSRSINHRPNHY